MTAAVEATEQPPPAEWNAFTRFGFRFLFAYLVLYLGPYPFGLIPKLGFVGETFDALTTWCALWTETHVFGLAKAVAVVPTGSGDTMKDFAWLFDTFAIAVIAAVVWSVLDRRRKSYERLYEWMRVYVRFGLAMIMFGYGFAKVIQTQFPPPPLGRMTEQFGDFSPMGLLWTFMGYSTAFNFFTGSGEVLGAFFLLFRRTATLGALLLIAVLMNIVLLNFTYDVPVKLYSSNLLLMACFIGAPDGVRLLNLLVLNRQTLPRYHPRLFTSQRIGRIAAIVATLVIGGNILDGLKGELGALKEMGQNGPKPPLYGIYDVQEFRKNGVIVPLVLFDSTHPKRLIINEYGSGMFRMMNDSAVRFGVKVDTMKHSLRLSPGRDTTNAILFAFERPDAEHLVLRRHFANGDSTEIHFRRFNEDSFRIRSRKFTWIQEFPFNR